MHNLDVVGRDEERGKRAGERALIQYGRRPINGKRGGKHPVANESKGNMPVPGNLPAELGVLGLSCAGKECHTRYINHGRCYDGAARHHSGRFI